MPALRRTPFAVIGIFALALLSACATPTPTPTPPADDAPTFVLTSPDLDDEGYLPDSARGNVERFCGDGDNVSPTFEWTGVPEGTESFALFMTDPAFPSYDHWVVTGIPGDTTSLPATPDGALTVGVVGANERGPGGYVGPCLADNGYIYTLYALDSEIIGTPETTLAEAQALIEGHVLAEASLEAMRRDVEND